MVDVETSGEIKAPVVDSTIIDGEAARKLKHPVSSGKKMRFSSPALPPQIK